MIKINNMIINKMEYNIFHGIEFNTLINHPNDGSSGFIICFIENWVSYITQYNRNSKINSIIHNTTYKEFIWEEIDNKFISIYQYGEIGLEKMSEIIIDKIRMGFHNYTNHNLDYLSKNAFCLTERFDYLA